MWTVLRRFSIPRTSISTTQPPRKPGRNGDEATRVRNLLLSRRYQDAFVAAKEHLRKAEISADDRLLLAEAAIHVGQIDEMQTAFRAALAEKPDLEVPWFLTRSRARLPMSSAVLYGLALHPSRPEVAAGGVDEKLHIWDLPRPEGRPIQYRPQGEYQRHPVQSGRGPCGLDRGRQPPHPARRLDRFGDLEHRGPLGQRRHSPRIPPGRPTNPHGGWDKAVKVWNAETGKLVLDLPGHTDSVLGVAWCRANPRRVASVSWDGTARVWDPETGLEVFPPLRGHKGHVGRVAFSPDGKLLATSGDDETVRLWNAETGSPEKAMRGHDGQVEPIAFTPDGQTLFSGGTRDGRVVMWDVATGKRREVIRVPRTGGVYGIVVTPDGKQTHYGGHQRQCSSLVPRAPLGAVSGPASHNHPA